MTGKGKFVEIQGTAEAWPFTRDDANKLIDLAENGIQRLISLQRKMLMGGEMSAEL